MIDLLNKFTSQGLIRLIASHNWSCCHGGCKVATRLKGHWNPSRLGIIALTYCCYSSVRCLRSQEKEVCVFRVFTVMIWIILELAHWILTLTRLLLKVISTMALISRNSFMMFWERRCPGFFLVQVRRLFWERSLHLEKNTFVFGKLSRIKTTRALEFSISLSLSLSLSFSFFLSKSQSFFLSHFSPWWKVSGYKALAGPGDGFPQLVA